MATNIRRVDVRAQVTAPATATSGTGILVGQLLCIPLHSAASGALVEVMIQGRIEIAKTSALAIDAGDAVYWDDTNKVVNKTSTAQKEVGVCVEAAANPSPTVVIEMWPNIRTSVAA